MEFSKASQFMMNACKATFELANGEEVSPCHLEKGHEGDHRGSVLGSICFWPQGFGSEEEMYKHYERKTNIQPV